LWTTEHPCHILPRTSTILHALYAVVVEKSVFPYAMLLKVRTSKVVPIFILSSNIQYIVFKLFRSCDNKKTEQARKFRKARQGENAGQIVHRS
jgi:amino acid permease